jgi:uncharacterized membrane protein
MSDEPPSPPAGYQEPYEPSVAPSWLELLPGEIGLLVGTALLFGWVMVTLRDATAVFAVVWQAVTLDSLGAWGVYLALVVTIGATLFFHEAVHAVAARWLGCEAQIGRQGLGVHVRLRGGFLSRRADAVITLAPAVVLTVVGLPVLVLVESAFGAAIVLTALVTNAAGIGSDLAAVLALRQLPPGTLLYYGNDAQLAYEKDTTGRSISSEA